MMTNVVPMRLAIEPTMSVRAVMNQTRRTALQGLLHQRYPIETSDAIFVASPGHCGAKISVRPFHVDLQFGGHPRYHTISDGPVDDLDFHFVAPPPGQGRLSASNSMRYPALYDQQDLARFSVDCCSCWRRLTIRMSWLVASIFCRPKNVNSSWWSGTERMLTIPGIVVCTNSLRSKSSVRRMLWPLLQDEQLTYRQLDERANQLARHLQKLGVGPDTLVGICVERSLEMVVGLLGILKAGGAYVPLDPASQDRLAFMFETQGYSSALDPFGASGGIAFHISSRKVVRLDADWPADRRESVGRSPRAKPEQLAYVIYTSGSTGKPKGVEITHRALVNLLASMQRRPGLTPTDTMLAVTTLSFDIAALEIFLPLVVRGARRHRRQRNRQATAWR